VVICENCKPILGEKIRYFQDKSFTDRLLPAPEVSVMKMDLHQAKVQQRWRYADDELDAESSTLDVDALVHDIHLPKEVMSGPIDKAADAFLGVFEVEPNNSSAGGSIEPASDESPSGRTAGTPPDETRELTTLGERS
jgi:type IV secretion system protein VirD4